MCAALLNVRSLKSKVDIVKDYIIEKHVDIFALTETWLYGSCTYESEEVTPSGYTFLRVDRQNKRGGGVGFISKEEYKPRLLKLQQYASFEHCVVELKHTTVLKFVVIYRPPSSSFACFISELTNLFEEMCLGDQNTIVTGDLNIHFEKDLDTHNRQYKELLHALGLKQYVMDPTHCKGHILDHIISRPSDAVSISNVHFGAQLSDHFTILSDILLKKPQIQVKSTTDRKINSIDMDVFRQDLRATKLCRDFETMDLQTLVDTYNTELGLLLDKHAPVISKTVRHSMRCPWYDNTVHTARKHTRDAERRYRKFKSVETYAMFRKREEQYHLTLQSAKTEYYRDLIDSNMGNQRKLFRTLNKIMHREQKNPLPDHSSSHQLANDFNE